MVAAVDLDDINLLVDFCSQSFVESITRNNDEHAERLNIEKNCPCNEKGCEEERQIECNTYQVTSEDRTSGSLNLEKYSNFDWYAVRNNVPTKLEKLR